MTTIQKKYLHKLKLKYGINPHQKNASILSIERDHLPFSVMNGTPGYVNLLDALNSWFLVNELDNTLKLPAASSFKHVSPAGVAISAKINDLLLDTYGYKDSNLSPLATAYIRARGADPLSSYGDFIGLSRKVDLSTANVIKNVVSDGVIAPNYDNKALELLKQKKRGKFIILKADPEFVIPEIEYRELGGVVFSQKRNNVKIDQKTFLNKIVTKNSKIPQDSCRDLLLASIALKYTQSNSVAFALDGQIIGIGAGQQSRLDCTKIARRKVENWFLRQHPKVRELPFHKNVNKSEKTNTQIQYIEGEFSSQISSELKSHFNGTVKKFTTQEKKDWISKLYGVSYSSDAFLPFRDNVDQAYKVGTKYLVQPGGSNRDSEIIKASNEYGMVMFFSGIRLFHH